MKTNRRKFELHIIFVGTRIITNIAGNSLFALPANQEFVYVETGKTKLRGALIYLL